ncbi:hypothetical protein [Streptomyces indiaensis]|uniref:hypothetical protein n=1 Tax=Streptomyces indiaensis TaxID=284033 RepID=UPI001F275FE0|nr:hypothetical protein [Streptomyces indiaensis]MCF1645985.1 hypothetical protein [Streptomyces indiaensis]
MSDTITALEARAEELRAQAAKPAAELDQVTAELEAARTAEAERQAGRGADWDRELLATWKDRDEQLRAEEQQARADFLKALQNDPVWSAWARMRATWHRRNIIRTTADGVRYREDPQGSQVPLLSYREPTILWDTIIGAIEDLGQDAAAAETERLHDEREAYAKADD